MLNKLFYVIIIIGCSFCINDTSFTKTNSQVVKEINQMPFLGPIPSLGQLHNNKPMKL